MKILSLMLIVFFAVPAVADQVSIEFAELNRRDNSWNISVRLKHKDTGWDHYANAWQVVDVNNKLLGKRVLFHPHVNEQPFTRSLYSVKLPVDTKIIYIEATDSVHGLSSDRLRIDLSKASGKRYNINK